MNIYECQWSLTLDQGHSDSIFLNFFSSITTRLFEAKFHMEPPWDGGMKAFSNGPGHLTKMTTMPIYIVKTFKNHLFWNRKADDLETCYAASSTTKFVQMMPLG